MKLIRPVNTGNHFSGLLEQIAEARSAVLTVASHVLDASPNARDYYPQGPGAFTRAVDSSAVVQTNLQALCTDLDLTTDTDGPEAEATVFGKLNGPLVLPTIHLNGTSRATLIADARRVLASVEHALYMMSRIVPNARDYATMADAETARLQHMERVALLKRVREYFLAYAQHCKSA